MFFREGATDEEIEAKVRIARNWTFGPPLKNWIMAP